MAARPERLTLDEYCAQKNVNVVTIEGASFVPPAYRKKPEAEQVMVGLANVQEVLLGNEETIFICVDDKLVFATAQSAGAHRSKAHRLPKQDVSAITPIPQEVISEQTEETRPKKSVDKQVAIRKTRSKEGSEETYGELRKKVEVLTLQVETLRAVDNVESLSKYRTQIRKMLKLASELKVSIASIDELDAAISDGYDLSSVRAKIVTARDGTISALLSTEELE